MIVVQWNIKRTPIKWLEDRGWVFIRQITEEWVEMGLGNEKIKR